METERIAAAVAAQGPVSGVLAAESAAGARTYLVSFGDGDARQWLVVDAGAAPVVDRATVRETASLVAMCELAAELAGAPDEARVASPGYLDAVGTLELGAAAAIVDAFVAEVEARYRLALR